MSNYIVPENLAISDSGFLFLSSTGETFTLNEIGKEVFRMLQAGRDLSSIEDIVFNEYDIDRSTFQRDLDDFINQLKNFKLIRTA